MCTGALALVLLLSTQAAAQTVTLSADLTGGEETPAALNTGMFGTVAVGVDQGSKELTVTLRVFNTPTPTTAGHIHMGSPGTPGPTVLNFPAGLNGRVGDFAMTFRLGDTAGVFTPRPAIGINTIDDVIEAVLGGNTYVNVHTTQNPGGEIRGQLIPRR
jgi:hypothetical protein